jgi:hypothetical protein
MAAQLQIDQTGLPAGTPGVSRTDGLDTGALVTLTNTGAGATTAFYLLWTPPGDTTAVLSLAPTGPTTWTFTPTVGVYGTYLIELVEDESTLSEVRERRVLSVRTPNRALIVPALNEIGDPKAFLNNDGPVQIEAADNNATDFPNPDLNTLQYAAWWRALYEFTTSLDDPDVILTALAPIDITKTAAVIGVATTAARADHKHDVATAAPVDVTKITAAEGTDTSLSRSDHKHDVSTASAGAATAGDTSLEGSATSLARSDHTHAITGGSPVDVTKSAAVGGVATTFIRSDHKHDVPTAIAGALVIDDAAAEGVATSLSRSDHRHSVAAGSPVDVTKAASSDGVATTFSRGDHKHDIPTAAPVAIGTSLQEGVSSSLSRADHVHTIPPATASADGYMIRTSITDGTVWTTVGDIPDGNRFQFILTGAGGGGAGGAAHRGSGSFSNAGGRPAGGGARPPPYWFSRAFLVSQLPITFTVPTGGLGGASVFKNNLTAPNPNPSLPGGSPTATTIIGAFGPIAFAGAGSGGGSSVGTGGGLWTSAVGATPGLPDDLFGVGSNDQRAFGGSQSNSKVVGGGSGVQTVSRHGGGGGGTAGDVSNPGTHGGQSQFGGGGGGGGGGSGQTGFSPVYTQGIDGGGHEPTFLTPFGGGGGTAVTDGAGNPGPDGNENVAGSGGAGGAGHSASGAALAFAGGAGGFPGGGGGGGGTATTGGAAGATSGAGGKGGDAEILLTIYL